MKTPVGGLGCRPGFWPLAVSFVLLIGLPPRHAAGSGGTWTSDASANWSDPARWSGGVVADGIDSVADFSTIDITKNRAVTNDSARTIGGLTFGDVTGAQTWTLGGLDPLTLDVSAGVPLITVLTNSTTISAPLDGSRGLSKGGAGTLILSGPVHRGRTIATLCPAEC